MISVYDTCFCGSTKKYKFCCYAVMNSKDPAKFSVEVAQWPIHSCLMPEDWEDRGIGSVLIIRTMPNAQFCISVYMIDAWFLGVKDTYTKSNFTWIEVQYMISAVAINEAMVTVSYETVRSFVLGSLAYAKRLGIEPHGDWKYTQHGIDSHMPFEDTFTFGRNGLPFYCAGPYEDAKKRRLYAEKATAAGGHFILPTSEDYFNEVETLL